MNKQIIVSIIITAVTIFFVQKYKYHMVAHETSIISIDEGSSNKQSFQYASALENTMPTEQKENKNSEVIIERSKMQGIQASDNKTSNHEGISKELHLECFHPLIKDEPTINDLLPVLQN